MKFITQDKDFGKRVKQIRNKLDLTQEEFGQKFTPPAPKSVVSRWEHGGKPNSVRINRIAELGNMSVDYLLQGNNAFSLSSLRNFIAKAYFANSIVTDNDGKNYSLTNSVDKYFRFIGKETPGSLFSRDKNPLSLSEAINYLNNNLDILSSYDFVNSLRQKNVFRSETINGKEDKDVINEAEACIALCKYLDNISTGLPEKFDQFDKLVQKNVYKALVPLSKVPLDETKAISVINNFINELEEFKLNL